MKVFELLIHILKITRGDVVTHFAIDAGIPKIIPKEAIVVGKDFLLLKLDKIPGVKDEDKA